MKTRDVCSSLVAAASITMATALRAQDPFEIQVYEYETVPKGHWNLETHFNYTVRGTTVPSGTVAPTEHQTHLTFELTRGLTDEIEFAGYLLFAERPGANPEVAGWRLRPRVRAPKRWHLPVDVSLSAEVGFPQQTYEENSATLEIRPILEKTFGPVQIDLNPVIGRGLKGPTAGEGWDFEPGVRIATRVSVPLELTVEYYGALGSPTSFLPAAQQVHQFFGGADVQLKMNVVLNVGFGVAATNAGNQRVAKLRLGWLF
jgi:hypothetical protein